MRRPQSPFALAVSILAGFLNRAQQEALDYLREENRVLRELLGGRRPRFTDAQRKRLAIRGKALGRALLRGVATLVDPDTILGWHRRLVARKWTYPGGAHGNADAMKAITKHVVRMARENPTWGYDRIQGALKHLGHVVCPNTVKAILRRNGIQPAPDRGRRTPWKTFLKAHARSIFAADFFTTEVWTMRGLVTHYTLLAIHHATRAVRIVGTTVNPGDLFMQQVAKVLTDPIDGFLRHARFLIVDRDSKFTAAFKAILKQAGVRTFTIPASAPNCNAYAERFIKSIVPRQDDLLRDRLAAAGAQGVRSPLPPRTAPPGRRQRAHRARSRRHDRRWARPTKRAPRRAPQLLPPKRGLTATRHAERRDY